MHCQHFVRNNKEPAKGVLVIITDRGRQKHSSLKYVPGKCNYCYSSNNLLKWPKTGQPAFQKWYKQDKRTIYVDHNWCCWVFPPTCLSMMWFCLPKIKNKNKKTQLFSEKYSVMRATNDFLNTQTLVWHTDKKPQTISLCGSPQICFMLQERCRFWATKHSRTNGNICCIYHHILHIVTTGKNKKLSSLVLCQVMRQSFLIHTELI